MGCWGITAFESDQGLDTLNWIRNNHIPENGSLTLETIVKEFMKMETEQDESWDVPNRRLGCSHSGPVALAEVIMKFLDRDISSLDYNGKWAAGQPKFYSLVSFTASKESIQWLRDYLSDTLKFAIKNADGLKKWGGWFEEKNWLRWQGYMKTLIIRLNRLLAVPESRVDLMASWEPEQRLTGRLKTNYRAYIQQLNAKPSSDLIEMAPRIAAAQFIYQELTAEGGSGGCAGYLLQFDNPLEAAVNIWLDGQRYDRRENLERALWTAKEAVQPESAPPSREQGPTLR